MGRNVLLCNQHIHSYHSFLNFIFMLCYIWCLQWWPGLVVRHWSRSMYLRCAGRVSTRLGDHLWAGKPSQYIISNPGQLSLSMPPWVGALSTSESWRAKRHIAWGTSPVFVVWQCKLVSGWGLVKQRSASPSGYVAWKDFSLQSDQLPGKPGNVGEFDSCQGNVRDFTKSQGNVREKSC